MSAAPFQRSSLFQESEETSHITWAAPPSCISTLYRRPSLELVMWRVLLLAPLLLQTAVADPAPGPIYLVTVTSKTTGGSTETLCAQFFHPNETLSFTITLVTETRNLSLLEEQVKEKEFYRCIPFQVPTVNTNTVVQVRVTVRGQTVEMDKETKILIQPSETLTFIQTDKPVYKPGQTIKFRIVSLDSAFVPLETMYPTVELQDPSSNRIAQWLNRTSTSGIVDLSNPMSPEALQGSYVITAWSQTGKETTHSFEIKEYVLPKYEVKVHLPRVITIMDKEATFKVCGKYTYGKPVLGEVTATFCRKGYNYYWYRSSDTQDICTKYSLRTDRTGCATGTVDLTNYALNRTGYEDVFNLESYLEEDGTGVILRGSSTTEFSSDIIRIQFEDLPKGFKTGIPLTGKIKVTRPDSSPAAGEPVELVLAQGEIRQSQNFTTDSNGLVSFSLDTSSWKSDSASLSAEYRGSQDFEFEMDVRRPLYRSAFQSLLPFYSKSKSFLKIQPANGPLPCDKDEPIGVEYIIQGEELQTGQAYLDFYYLVVAKGSIVRNGRLEIQVKTGEVNKGELSLILEKTIELAPVAQVVVYTVLPNGEAVADSFDFEVQLCFKNKVSLKFSSSEELPGGDTTLSLQAQPGSLCALRAIDQSVLLMSPEKELNAQNVYRYLPIQKLSEYPYDALDKEEDVCIPNPIGPPGPFGMKRQRFFYFPYERKYDVYHIFQDVGLKIMTNSDIKKPVDCHFPMYDYMVGAAGPFQDNPVRKGFAEEQDSDPVPVMDFAVQSGMSSEPPKKTIRTYFPETWIWQLVPVGESGSVKMGETVPDTITKWEAGAFCTSPVGFGLAPSTQLTAFQPFFVEVTLPYSVIRSEVFQLKATVFNYLSKCIMVKASLAESSDFKSQPCDGCQYTQCLCAEESKTFTWILTATTLGEVNVSVTAEALKTEDLCGNEVATVPEKGRMDIIVRTLLVEAEGTEQTKSHNRLMCPADGPVKEQISLTLPEVIVEGSAKASISVLGDILGRAMKNLDKLLAMPFGCGEQNMILFSPNIYILKYLESTHQLTQEIKNRATGFLQSGYQRELNYKHDDGSYSAFGKSDESGNTWLTAFVLKSFGSARPYIFIDPQHTSEAKRWLSQLQRNDGCFESVGKLFHNEMKGGVSDEVSLTAYIVAGLLELEKNVTDPIIENSLSCLRPVIGNLNNTYTMALLSYTFTLAGDEAMRGRLLTELDALAKTTGGSRHWSRSGDDGETSSLDVEMTSYVLLALLSGPELPSFGLGYSSSIVRWLVKQQNPYGGFSSTQDTVVALQALALYGAATFSPEGSTTLTVRSAGDYRREFTVNQDTRLLYQEEMLKEVKGEYTLEAQGKSCIFVQIAQKYNIPPPPDFSAFTISAEAKGNCSGSGKKVLTVTVEVRYNGKRKETNMVIINVKLLSGFILVESSIPSLKGAVLVKRVDTDEGNVIIYLDNLESMIPVRYSFLISEDIPVRNLQPAIVKIYDYYQTRDEAVSQYTSPCAEDDTLNQV
ncbi:alpha-2-macroglobulin-like protein 1 isoform X2 [Lepisosteus oculatus]|uniref:alpha-2-macroglobulin-like protein 1 isoform X2 n=1 Tax=Lepisosteus oculatus TaxID=7918 RepID=UPI003721DDB3